MVNVYETEEMDYVIGRVKYNNLLDYWDGRNYTNGGIGVHKGITRLKDGQYVIIIGSDWQDDVNYGYIVSAKKALQEIVKSGNLEVLDIKKFKELKEVYEQTLGNTEMES